jgi:hypothetical protein
MPVLTKTSEQQKVRTDLGLAVEGSGSELHSKFTSYAIQSTVTYSVAQTVGRLEKAMTQQTQQLSALKRAGDGGKPSGGESGAPAAKKTKSNGGARPKWTQLKQDRTLQYCGSFDKSARRQCGWNSDHRFGPDCPVVKADPGYVPKFYGPLGSGWDKEKAMGEIPLTEIKTLYKADVDRWVSKHPK